MTEQYIGQITLFSIGFVPEGFLECDGRLLDISQNTALFSLLGKYYGGDGVKNFAIPDLRGRIWVGGALNNPPQPLGKTGGTSTVTLAANNIPTHTHALQVSDKPGTQSNLLGNPIPAALASTAANLYGPISSTTQTPMNATSFLPYGSSTPYSNMQPYLALRFCICVQGYYPPRPN